MSSMTIEAYTKACYPILKNAVFKGDLRIVKAFSAEYNSRWQSEGTRYFKALYNELRKEKKAA